MKTKLVYWFAMVRSYIKMLLDRLNYANVKPVVYSVLGAGVLLRAMGIITHPLWFDEAYSLYLSRFNPLQIAQLAIYDHSNPPLWELIAWVSTRLLGETELAMRLPSLLASLVALWLGWYFVKGYIDSWRVWQRVAGAAVISLLPIYAWVAQDGRIYSVFAMLYLLAIWFVMRKRWLGLTATVGLLLYAHSTAPVYVAALFIGAWLLNQDRVQLKRSVITGLVAYLPWGASAFIYSVQQDFWLQDFTIGKLLMAFNQAAFAGTLPGVYGLFAGVLIVALIVLAGMFGLSAAIRRFYKRDAPDYETATILGMWACGPIVAMVLASMLWKPILFYRPITAAIMPLMIWVIAILWPRRLTLTTWVIPYSIAVLMLIGLIGWVPQIKAGDLADVTRLINITAKPGDVIYHATGTSALPVALYTDLPNIILDEKQHDGLLNANLATAFGFQRAALEDVPHKRAWVFWSLDPLMTDAATNRMAGYVEGAQLVGVISYWQAAPIQIYLVEGAQ